MSRRCARCCRFRRRPAAERFAALSLPAHGMGRRTSAATATLVPQRAFRAQKRACCQRALAGGNLSLPAAASTSLLGEAQDRLLTLPADGSVITKRHCRSRHGQSGILPGESAACRTGHSSLVSGFGCQTTVRAVSGWFTCAALKSANRKWRSANTGSPTT